VDLEALNFTPEKLLIAVRRSTRARYRYVHQCNEQGVKVDPAVEHQLTNHMMLLQDIAQAVGLDSDVVVEAMQRGTAQAREEARV
jgi:hypothetical protein